jgi:hypothetical protein
MAEIANPLSKYYRQPSIYIKLPTGGKYYGADTFTPTETGEVPILPMTARDELLFKTPDAMMNGQATVDVIKSCVPNFKDPWQMTNYDTDAVLIGIRIATYGETMDITYRTPVTNNEVTQSVNLPALLERLAKKEIREFIDNADSKIVNDLQIELGKIRTQFQIPPLEIKATEDEIKEGVPTRYQIPITFDNSNFFV